MQINTQFLRMRPRSAGAKPWHQKKEGIEFGIIDFDNYCDKKDDD
jgi:hypothetical protein